MNKIYIVSDKQWKRLRDYYVTMRYTPATYYDPNLEYCIKDYTKNTFYGYHQSHPIWCENQVHGKYLHILRVKPGATDLTIELSELYVYFKTYYIPQSLFIFILLLILEIERITSLFFVQKMSIRKKVQLLTFLMEIQRLRVQF